MAWPNVIHIHCWHIIFYTYHNKFWFTSDRKPAEVSLQIEVTSYKLLKNTFMKQPLNDEIGNNDFFEIRNLK